MDLMNLYDKESELSYYERIEMYRQIIEELKSNQIFETILFDIIASLRKFHDELQSKPILEGAQRRSSPSVLKHFYRTFSHILPTALVNPLLLSINHNHVYNDSQNVHEFVASTIKIAKEIMIRYPAQYKRPSTLRFKLFFDVIESATVNGIKACDIFASIYSYILYHEHKEEMLKRLIEEINDCRETCASGHVTRMINSIRGFQDDFCTKLDDYESTKAKLFNNINKEFDAYELFSLDVFERTINSGRIIFPCDLKTTLRILKDYSKIEWSVEQVIQKKGSVKNVFKSVEI